MSLLTNILLIASLILLIALAIRTGENLKTRGMPALFAIIVFFSVWVGGNLIELNTLDFQWMLWGRNIQQIGVFLTPLCTLYFSIEYTGNERLRRLTLFITIIQIISVFLIFTDHQHHIMRESVALQTDAVVGQVLVVQSSKVGSLLVAFNFCLPLVSIANLIAFSRKVSSQVRRSLWMIIISMFATFALALIQSTILSSIGIHIPIPVLNIPSLVLFSYAVLKEGFAGVAPTALNKVFEVIDQGIIVVDEQGKVIEYNRRAYELMDDLILSRRLQTGLNIAGFLLAGDSSVTPDFSVRNLPVELKNTKRNQYIALAYHALQALTGKLIGYVLVLTDITLLKVRAEIDYLTGSYNRVGLANAFADLQRDFAYMTFLSALIIDLDDFKAINDTYGHLGGDVILCDFVGVAQSLLLEKRFLSRLGGDEFVVILPMELNEAAVLAEKLRQCISARAVQYSNHVIQYTVSIGVASCRNDGCVLSELLHMADMALYEAKSQGKNSIYVRAVV